MTRLYLFWLAGAYLYAQSCGYLYVSPTAAPGGAGTPADPMPLATAITQAAAGPIKHIRLAVGDYNLTQPLSLEDGIILEGGFDLSNPAQPVKQVQALRACAVLAVPPKPIPAA